MNALPTLTCLRCSHEWHPRTDNRPTCCPGCHSPYWDRPRTREPIDREPGHQTTCTYCDGIVDEDAVLEVSGDNYCSDCASTCPECDSNFLVPWRPHLGAWLKDTISLDGTDYCSEECAGIARERTRRAL